MLYIWVFQKTFYRIVGCSDSWEPTSLYARKKAIWWRDDGIVKKYRIERNFKTLKRQWILESRIIFKLNPLNDIGVWMQIFIMTAMVNHGLSLTFTAVLLSPQREVWNRLLTERLVVIWRAGIWDVTLEPALEWMWTCIAKSLVLQTSHLQLPMWMYIDWKYLFMDLILYSKFPHESNFGATDLSRGGVRVGNIIHATCFYLSEQRKAEIILQEIADDNQGLMFQLRTQKSKVVWTSK